GDRPLPLDVPGDVLKQGAGMTFRDTLDKHLRAIKGRDLQALVETLPGDELVLIMSDGRLVRSVREFVEAHRGWFESPTWTLDTQLVSVRETPDLAVAGPAPRSREHPGRRQPDARDELPDARLRPAGRPVGDGPGPEHAGQEAGGAAMTPLPETVLIKVNVKGLGPFCNRGRQPGSVGIAV